MMVQMNLFFLVLISVGTWQLSHAQPLDPAAVPPADVAAAAANPADNPVAMQLLSQAMFTRFSNFSHFFGPDVKKHLAFCIRDMDDEWNRAFNFSKNSQFLAECLVATGIFSRGVAFFCLVTFQKK